MERMTHTEYDALPGVRWSVLKAMQESPRAYLHRRDNPISDSPGLLLGRAVHTAVLEPDRFPLEYVVFPGKVRRGAQWEQFQTANADKDILKADEYAQCLAIRDAVRAHPVAAEILSHGQSERVIQWKDGATGIACKAKLDWFDFENPGAPLVDLKSTGTFGDRFAATAARLGYHRQLAFYRQGLKVCGYEPADEALIIAAQSDPPHDVCVYRLEAELLDYAWTEVRKLLERLKRCEARNNWPGMAPDEVVKLELPLWAYPDEEPMQPLLIGGEAHAL